MNLGSKIEVPEVDELRLARIERNVLAGIGDIKISKNTSGLHWLRISFGAMAVASIVLFLVLRTTDRGDGAATGTAAQETRLVTGPGQSDELTLGDAKVIVAENTTIAVQRNSDQSTVIVLESGAIHCEVEPRANRPEFLVLAGDVKVTVVGTIFGVSREKTVGVTVERGVVRVATSHTTLKLHAGESWEGSPSANTTIASLRAHTPQNPPDPVEPAVLGSKGNQHHVNSEKDAGVSSKPGHRTRHHRNADFRDAGPTAKTVELGKVLNGANPIRPVVQPSHGAKARELMAIASSNPKRAVVELEALGAKSTGNEASFALYSRAYLLFFKLGKRAEVVRAAQQYERRFPRGHEAEDMLWLRVRASCDSSNKSSSCRAAAHTYRRRYPKGVFQALAARIIRTKESE